MNSCPECGKAMATAAGLEIHGQLAHAAPPPPPEVSPSASPVVEIEPLPAPAPPPVARQTGRPGPSALFAGLGASAPVTALLIVVMLVAGLGTAVTRASSTHHATVTASAAPDAAVPSATPPGTSDSSSASEPSSPGVPTTSAPSGSTAAAPTTLPAVSSTDAGAAPAPCEQALANLTTRASRRTADLGALLQTGSFPSLPLAGFEHPAVSGAGHWPTAQDYLADKDVIDPALWAERMSADHFLGADAALFTANGEFFGAETLRFATPSAAADFQRATLQSVCAAGVMANTRALTGLTQGVSFLLPVRGTPPFRAAFVAGDTVVHLDICECVEAPDDLVLVGQWAHTVAAAVGAQ